MVANLITLQFPAVHELVGCFFVIGRFFSQPFEMKKGQPFFIQITEISFLTRPKMRLDGFLTL